MSDNQGQKTLRLSLILFTVCLLGTLFFAYKINACAEKPPQAAPSVPCKDEFFQVDADHPNHACTPGAKAEWVSSPPAPRPGIICHCPHESLPLAPPATQPSL